MQFTRWPLITNVLFIAKLLQAIMRGYIDQEAVVHPESIYRVYPGGPRRCMRHASAGTVPFLASGRLQTGLCEALHFTSEILKAQLLQAVDMHGKIRLP